VIADPTAIPETEDDAKEYEQELQAAGGDWPRVEPLARALSQSDVASRQARAMAYSALGNALENTGRADEAIDAYRRAVDMGDTSAQALVDGLLAKEQRGPVEESHLPQNEAEAGEYLRLAKAALEAGDWERADQLFTALYQSPANDAAQKAQAALGLGMVLRHRNEGDAAMQYLQEASQIGSEEIRAAALSQLGEMRVLDDNVNLGSDVPSSTTIDSSDAAATVLQAGIDRYEVSDMPGAKARFEAVHAASAASNEQRGFAAYYLASLAWNEGDYDVARVQFREAKQNADSNTAGLAAQMLQTHWGE
jgi:tetratricopeptide (TPR) repeat protein